MNVRKKAILTIGIMFSLTLVIVLLTSQTVILASFQKLENNDTETQIGRATDGLNSEAISLDTFVRDYATWDDTYAFIQNNNTAYVLSNLIDETFSHSSLNLMMYLNSSGYTIFFKTYNLVGTTENSVYETALNLLSSNDSLWSFANPGDYVRGIISMGGSLFLIASRPILTSDGLGPVRGAVLMARELSATRIATLEAETHLEIKIASLTDTAMSSDLNEALTHLSSTVSVYIKPLNSTVVAGYALLNDVNGNRIAILNVDLQRNIYSEGVTTVNTFTLMIAFLFIAFGVATVMFLEKALLSRIAKLTVTVSKITNAGDINQRIGLGDKSFRSKNDEVNLLSKSINQMLDKIQEITGALNRSQRLAAIGELSVMIAHDLRNPLQGITTAADFLALETASSPEKRTRMLDLIKGDVAYCEKIVNDLLGYSRDIRIMPSATDVNSLLATSLSHARIPESVQITDLTQKEPMIKVDTEKMLRVFDNILKNAIEAMPEGGNLTIKNEASNNTMHISFEDTGKGIAKEDLNKLFVPLYTTKAKGMGFGLAICKRIIDAHNGTISVESSVGKGAIFTIELPL